MAEMAAEQSTINDKQLIRKLSRVGNAHLSQRKIFF
jgi:hypothetical protein